MMKNISQADRPSYLDENRELLLKSLLSSKNPEDHAKANKLIQKLIAEDDEKIEKQAKKIENIDQALSYSKELIHLVEVLPANSNGANLSESDRRKVDELYVNCTRLRPTIFRMASENEQSEADLTKILKANDELTKAIQLFDLNVGKILHHPDNQSEKQKETGNLLDFDQSSPKSNTDVLTSSLLDLGLGDLVSNTQSSTANSSSTPMTDLLMNGNSLSSNQNSNIPNVPSIDTSKLANTANNNTTTTGFLPSQTYTIEQLSLDAQKATTIYDKNNIRCLATPCQNKIILFTLMSTSGQALSNFELQLSVTKGLKCFLSEPDKKEIKAFSPIMPNMPINQIVYFSLNGQDGNNSSGDSNLAYKIQVRFRLLYTLGENKIVETGESSLELLGGSNLSNSETSKNVDDLLF